MGWKSVYLQPSLKCLRIISVNRRFSKVQSAKLSWVQVACRFRVNLYFWAVYLLPCAPAKANSPFEVPIAAPL